MRRSRLGLSVIEIMVALVVLATGVLITIEAISFSIKATSSSAQNTEATAYSRRILEIVLSPGVRAAATATGINPAYTDLTLRSLYDGDVGPPAPFTIKDFVRSTDPRDIQRFGEAANKYKLTVRVTPYTDALGGAYTASLFQVLVEVHWRDKLGPRSVKTGGVFHRG